MSSLEIYLLGAPQVRIDGVALETERRKATALLAYLIVEDRPMPREQLSGFFWPDYERGSALAYLRRELYEINRAVGKGWIETDRRTVRFVSGASPDVDVRRFEALSLAEDTLAQAADLYRGEFMSGFYLADTGPFEAWQRERAVFYARRYAQVLEGLTAQLEGARDWEAALVRAGRWLQLDPLDEAANRALMRIHAGMGDRAGALRRYEQLRRLLKEELGLAPHADTDALFESIRSGQSAATRAAVSENSVQNLRPDVRLPVLTTPFIGRQPEIDAAAELLVARDSRILTLLGPGGTGKTRLAVQTAAQAAGAFPDGVYFVPLAAYLSADDIPAAISTALDFHLQRNEEPALDQLIDFLRKKRLLLVLDNLEHLAGPETGALLIRILGGADNVRMLVTTRERINIGAEQLYNVSGMRLPDRQAAAAWADPESASLPYSAVRLFLDRAQRIRPDFKLGPGNVLEVVDICSFVNGLPLGIELAAAWMELLTPAEIAAEIRRSIDFLSTEQPDFPERQRSLRAVFEYSWKLLNEQEKDAFVRLNVFEGSFSNEAARAVTGASLRTLLSLANKSWLQQAEDGHFQLHPLLRHFGRERLNEDPALLDLARQLHAGYYADFTAEQAARMRGAQQPDAVREISREFATNIRATWYRFVETGDWEALIDKMLFGLYHFSEIRWRGDTLAEWIRDVLPEIRPGGADAGSLRVFAIFETLSCYEEINWNLHEYAAEARLVALWEVVHEHALETALGFWYFVLGGQVRAGHPSEDVEQKLDRALRQFRSQGDAWLYHRAYLERWTQADGLAVTPTGQIKVLTGEVLPFFRSSGSLFEQVMVLVFLYQDAVARRQPVEAVMRYMDEIRELQLALGDRIGYGSTFWFIGSYHFSLGDPDAGFEAFKQAQAEFERANRANLLHFIYNWTSQWALRYSTIEHALEMRRKANETVMGPGREADRGWDDFELAEIYRVSGQIDKARERYAMARLNFERLGLANGLGYLARAYGDLAMADSDYAEALRQYEAFIRFAVEDNHDWSVVQGHARAAWACAHLEELIDARRHIRAGLDEMEAGSEDILILAVFLAEARCLAVEGQRERSAALAAAIAQHRTTWREYRELAENLLTEVCKNLDETAVDRAMRQYTGLDAEALKASWLADRL